MGEVVDLSEARADQDQVNQELGLWAEENGAGPDGTSMTGFVRAQVETLNSKPGRRNTCIECEEPVKTFRFRYGGERFVVYRYICGACLKKAVPGDIIPKSKGG